MEVKYSKTLKIIYLSRLSSVYKHVDSILKSTLDLITEIIVVFILLSKKYPQQTSEL